MYGMRALSMFTSLYPLRYGRCLRPPSSTLKAFRNLSQTSWSSPKNLKQSEAIKFGSCFLRPTVVYFSSQPRPSEDDIKISKVILSLKTVKEQLELFESIKNSVSIVNRVTMLHSIAKITGRDGSRRRVLEQKKAKSRQVLQSAYLELLDSISKDIAKCQLRYLTLVFWSLGKLEEKDHGLVQVCESAILSHDITAFGNTSINQIVGGSLSLDLTASKLSSILQKSVLEGQVKICNFKNPLLAAMLMLFAKSDGCAVELFDIFLEEILSRDFLLMDNSALALFVWSFAKMRLNADTLFDKVEEEILRRGAANFERVNLVQILWSFRKARKGGKQLFNIMDNELALRGVEGFDHSELSRIVWFFATRNGENAKAFDLVKDEVFNRGVGTFQGHELVLILYSFVYARREDEKLVKIIEDELLSKDVEQFNNSTLCRVAWSLGRAGKWDSEMFDVIETGVLHLGVHQFSKGDKFLLLRRFMKAKRGSRKLYEGLQVSFLKSTFSDFTARDICDLAWCFSRAEDNTGPLINTEELFDTLEKEILTKGDAFFSKEELDSIKQSFFKVGKGTNELFAL